MGSRWDATVHIRASFAIGPALSHPNGASGGRRQFKLNELERANEARDSVRSKRERAGRF